MNEGIYAKPLYMRRPREFEEEIGHGAVYRHLVNPYSRPCDITVP